MVELLLLLLLLLLLMLLQAAAGVAIALRKADVSASVIPSACAAPRQSDSTSLRGKERRDHSHE